jgi:hypothetical protein
MLTFAYAFCFSALTFGTLCVMLSAAVVFGLVMPDLALVYIPFLVCIVVLVIQDVIVKRNARNLPKNWVLCPEDSLFAKGIQTWCAIAGVFAVSLFFYGIFAYHDAPIRPGPNGTYISKSKGKRYTRTHYEAFLRWEAALITAWPGMMLMMVGTDRAFSGARKRK